MKWPDLTEERIAAFECEPGKNQKLYWDGACPGLGVRVTMAHVKSFIFEARWNGKTVRMTIGDVRAWSIEQARERARVLRRAVDVGRDPRKLTAE